MIREKTCCFTGHREIPENQQDSLEQAVKTQIIKQIEKGYCYFMVGGALGFDTLAARMVLALREEYPHIQLLLALPCKEQTKSWSLEDIAIYEEIKAKSNAYLYTSEHYYRGCMQKRNQFLVDHSSLCMAYLLKPVGGTAFTVNYAKKNNLPVINVGASEDSQEQISFW